MKVHFYAVTLLTAAILAAGCAHQKKAEPLPAGWESCGVPEVEGFAPEALTDAARKLLHYKGAVAFMSMNSSAREEDLSEIIDGMQDTRSRGEPNIYASRDALLIADAVGQALFKFRDVNLSGLKVVIAAPNRPSDNFLTLLRNRKIEPHYLHVDLKR